MDRTIEVQIKELPKLWCLAAIVEFPAGGNWCIETRFFVSTFADSSEEIKRFGKEIETDGFKIIKAQLTWMENSLLDKLNFR